MWVVSACLLVLSACASPTSKLVDIAEIQQLNRSELQANGFAHLVFQNSAAQQKNSEELNVYLEGDGTPWKYRVLRMRDPTPRQPLMLALMGMDDSAAVYLGRPCYNGSFDDNGCTDTLWTSARYSETVVAAMTNALMQLKNSIGAKRVRLFGHSGGGTLAMLIAERMPEVTHVVTLAANLDIDAWVQHHRYSPLYGSLNPATREPLRTSVTQWHFIGRQDSVIPPTLVKRFIESQPNAFGAEFGAFTHGCCWQRVWPSVLKGLENDQTQRIPGMRFKYPSEER